ncbi:DUF1707 and DUF4870 domain-containing protein [Kribbella deserti]|uniref:DUF1707 and DUF4870 domain-containing protein n=1 Tax=Kribbella deserti TaxID=1926257 RepID=A0ABV6QPL5_9ACTN
MSTSDLLVTPEQRDRGVEILQEMYADGRLGRMEFEERLDQALRARTRADLNASFTGLVSHPVPTFAPAAFTRPTKVQRYDGDGRGVGTLTHWLGFPTSFVGPAVVAMTAGSRNPAVRRHAVEAVNFQLTAALMFAGLGVLTGITDGFTAFLFPVLGLLWAVLTGVGGLATALGGNFRYPATLRLIR